MTFEDKIKAAFGKRGEEWLATLPDLIKEVQEAEGLHAIEPFSILSYNYVARAAKGEKHVVVKIGLSGYDFTNEVNALRVFPKGVIASLLTSNTAKGYYIMESLTPGLTLHAKFPDTRTNVRIFVEQWRRLHATQSFETNHLNHQLPHIDTWFDVLDKPSDEVPSEWLTEAKLSQQRLKDLQQDTNLHGDLHHENILWDDTRGLTIIDPKGVVGHTYYDCVQFLFNKNESVDEFVQKVDWFIEEHEFDEEILIDAIKALGMVYMLWAYEDHDPEAEERFKMMQRIMDRT